MVRTLKVADLGRGSGVLGGGRYAPPASVGRGWVWVVLCVLWAGMLTPLLSGLGGLGGLSLKEAEALSLARGTWERSLRMSDEGWASVDRWVPAVEGERVLDRAPGLTWAFMSAWWTADPATTSDEELLFRARMTGVCMSLLALAGAYWAGYSLGGMQSAVVEGLVVMSSPMVIAMGRMASEESHVVGWSVLAGAGALWAMRPMKPSASLLRQGLGWGLCGLSMGLAVLCGGIEAALPAALPLVAVALVCPRRVGNVLGLAASGAIAGLVVGPWVLYVHQGQGGLLAGGAAWEGWWAEASGWWSSGWFGNGWVGGVGGLWSGLMGAWGLWVLLVVVAMVWPWLPMSSAVGGRGRALVGWTWLVGVLVLVLLSGGELSGTALLMAGPVAGVAIGQTLAGLTEAAESGRRLKVWRWAGVPTAVGVTLLSIGLPAAVVWPGALLNLDWLSGAAESGMSGWYWLAVGVLLVFLASAAGVWVLGDRPTRAAACWGAWHTVAVTAVTLVLLPNPASAPNTPVTGPGQTLKAAQADDIPKDTPRLDEK